MASVDEFTVIYPPDVCRWISDDFNDNLILCGSYKLVEDIKISSSYRKGGLLNLCDTLIDLTGVLSLSLLKEPLKFVSGLSCGSLVICSISESNKIQLINRENIAENEMILSICPVDNYIWCSTSKGNILRCEIEKLNNFDTFFSSKVIESWCVTSNSINPCLAFSSFDDGSICQWDSRSKECQGTLKSHDTGVCSLSWCPLDSNILCSGGFDQFLCFWDLRSLKIPCSKIQTDFSTWELRWFSNNGVASVSTIWSGSLIIQIDLSLFQMKQIASYTNPKSMVYSSDIMPSKEMKSYLVCCTSFYDSKLHVWKY